MQDINVCICEDDLDYAQQVKTYILHNFSKLKVFVCDDDSLPDEKFNLYILDVELKHSTGFEIAKQLKLRHQDVNIIFLTTHEEFARKGYEYQASAYVSKNYLDVYKRQLIDSNEGGIGIMSVRNNICIVIICLIIF